MTTLRTLARRLLPLTLAWYVVTYSGQRMAGPFTLLGDCTDMAAFMAQRYYNISQVCRHF